MLPDVLSPRHYGWLFWGYSAESTAVIWWSFARTDAILLGVTGCSKCWRVKCPADFRATSAV